MRPDADPPTHLSRVCGCEDGCTERAQSMDPPMQWRTDGPIVLWCRRPLCQRQTMVGFMCGHAAWNGNGAECNFARMQQSRKAPTSCQRLLFQLATPHLMPRLLSWESVRLKIRRSPSRPRIQAKLESCLAVHFGVPTLGTRNACDRRRRAGARPTSCGILLRLQQRESVGFSCLMVTYIDAIDVTRVRFRAEAMTPSTNKCTRKEEIETERERGELDRASIV